MEKQIIEVLERYQTSYGDQYGEINFVPVEKFKEVAKEIWEALNPETASNSAPSKTIFQWAELFEEEIRNGASQSDVIQLLQEFKNQ